MRTKELITAELKLANAEITIREQAKQLAAMQHTLASTELPQYLTTVAQLQAELAALPKENNVDA